MTRTQLGLLLFAWLVMSGHGAAYGSTGIYRCVGDNEVPVFSDRTCSALGIDDHKPKTEAATTLESKSVRYDCSRRIETLQTRVRAALETGDINQLAGLYHWMDATTETADMLMSELQVISSRRLATIEMESLELEGMAYPTRLWMDQYGAERPGQTIRTGFNLVMASGCWWLSSR